MKDTISQIRQEIIQAFSGLKIPDFQHGMAEDEVVETLMAKFRSEALDEHESKEAAPHIGMERFAPFNQAERKAIVAYLRYKASTGEDVKEIEKALVQYWLRTIAE